MNPKRAWWAGLLALALTLVGGLAPRPAAAANTDIIQSWDASYVVEASGSMVVTEKLTYVFPRSDAHGIKRGLVVREPWKGDKGGDRTYDVEILSVTATNGVSASYQKNKRQTSGPKGSNEQVELQVGSSSRTVPMNVPITYTLTYRVRDGLVPNAHGTEFYWDVVPSDVPLSVQKASATVTFPSGEILDASCYAGTTGAGQGGCATSDKSGATYTATASQLGHGRGMTIGATVPSSVAPATGPTLVKSAADAAKQGLLYGGVATVVSTLASVLGGLLWWRRKGRDERFIGLPPGIIPGPGEAATVGLDDKPQIPVAFTPPAISPGEAGLLIDGIVDVRDTTSTLIDLAVRGVVAIDADREQETFNVILRDPSIPVLDHERVLLDEIFGGARAGAVEDLTERGVMQDAHQRVTTRLTDMVHQRGWFVVKPSGLGGMSLIGALVPALIAVAFFVPGAVGFVLTKLWWLILPLVPILITLAIIGVKRMRGRRTATGRAVADQVEGFRTYLATAEADQLRFEEGEDIFSRYLPWAIMFDLTERWTKLCQELVAMGRIPDVAPSWYYGHWYGFGYFDTGYLNDSMNSAVTPPPSDSGSGSGGGSSWGGGGFVGGGGGGGSAGSW